MCLSALLTISSSFFIFISIIQMKMKISRDPFSLQRLIYINLLRTFSNIIFDQMARFDAFIQIVRRFSPNYRIDIDQQPNDIYDEGDLLEN